MGTVNGQHSKVKEIMSQQRLLKLARDKVANLLNKKILIISGDQTIREMVRGYLETLGFSREIIKLNNSSAEFISGIKEDPSSIDLVICHLKTLDNRVSTQTGYQLLTISKGILLERSPHKTIPFVFVEKEFEKKDIVTAFRAGAAQFIVFPSNPISMGGKLAEVFEKPKESLHSQEISKILFEGNRFQDQGLFDKAISHYNKALKIGGENEKVLTEKGNTLMKMGDMEQAIQVFKRAAEIGTNFPRAYQGLGTAYSQIGNFQEAKESFRKVLELEPHNVLVQYNIGVLHQDEGDHDSAQRYFEQGIKLNSKFLKNYLGLAKNYEAQDNPRESLKTYQEAMKHHPDQTFLFVTAGDFCLKHDLNQEAEDIFNKAISANGTHIHLYNRMGIALRKQKKFNEAITNFAKAIKINSDDANLRYNLAKAYYLKGEEIISIEKLLKAFELDSDLRFKFEEDGNFSKLMGKYPEKFK